MTAHLIALATIIPFSGMTPGKYKLLFLNMVNKANGRNGLSYASLESKEATMIDREKIEATLDDIASSLVQEFCASDRNARIREQLHKVARDIGILKADIAILDIRLTVERGFAQV